MNVDLLCSISYKYNSCVLEYRVNCFHLVGLLSCNEKTETILFVRNTQYPGKLPFSTVPSKYGKQRSIMDYFYKNVILWLVIVKWCNDTMYSVISHNLLLNKYAWNSPARSVHLKISRKSWRTSSDVSSHNIRTLLYSVLPVAKALVITPCITPLYYTQIQIIYHIIVCHPSRKS